MKIQRMISLAVCFSICFSLFTLPVRADETSEVQVTDVVVVDTGIGNDSVAQSSTESMTMSDSQSESVQNAHVGEGDTPSEPVTENVLHEFTNTTELVTISESSESNENSDSTDTVVNLNSDENTEGSNSEADIFIESEPSEIEDGDFAENAQIETEQTESTEILSSENGEESNDLVAEEENGNLVSSTENQEAISDDGLNENSETDSLEKQEASRYYTLTLKTGETYTVVQGDSEIDIYSILSEMGIEGVVESADSSNENLFEVAKDAEGKWTLVSKEPFETDETLTLKLEGQETPVVLNVTDPEEVLLDLDKGSVHITDSTEENGSSSLKVTGVNTKGEAVDVTVSNNSTVRVKQSNSQTETTSNFITVILEKAQSVVNLILDKLNIFGGTSQSPVSVDAADGSTVNMEIDGTNTLSASSGFAGIQKIGEGLLSIFDNNSNGTLNVTGGTGGAGIGGSNGQSTDNITINGGSINATGGEWGAGIGGGKNGNAENITITGGNVTALAGERSPMPGTNNYGWGAGIGGGQNGNGSHITISGGTVYAAAEEWAAGIGGGCGHYGIGGDGTDIKITGGNVTAIGGSQSAGIGGGVQGVGKNITIEGGNITAIGGPDGSGGAGIGGGCGEDGTFITISGGVVNATGGHAAAGIGGGLGGSGRDILISDGKVTATGGYWGAGIGGGEGGKGIVGGAEASVGERITISGGTVVAESGGMGAGIGGGSGCRGTDITITGGTVTAIGKDGGAAIGGGGVSNTVGYGAYGSNIYVIPSLANIRIWNGQTSPIGYASSEVMVGSRFLYQSTDAKVFISDSALPVFPEPDAPDPSEPNIPEQPPIIDQKEIEKLVKQFTVTNKHGKEAEFEASIEGNNIVLNIQNEDGNVEVKGNSISKLADAGIKQIILSFDKQVCNIDISEILEFIKPGDKVRFAYIDDVVVVYVNNKEVKKIKLVK